MHITLATRGSRLALAQSRFVADLLVDRVPGLTVELMPVKTAGDLRQERPLHQISGKGFFVKEVDRAVLDGSAQIAVHSVKDLPMVLTPGIVLAAIPPRAACEDVLAGFSGNSLDDIPRGSTIASGSLRRQSQLLYLRPDLNLVPIRGNVETRLKRVRENRWIGTVLALAGIQRLDLQDIPYLALGKWMLPAAGQGALAVTVRENDAQARELAALIDDGIAHSQVLAERAFLMSLAADCRTPVGVNSWVRKGRILLHGAVFAPGGSARAGAEVSGELAGPEAAGRLLADHVRAAGGEEILQGLRA